jgi:predicted nucleic acid-binding protein
VSALVIDASVAIKWVIAEEGSTQALALRRHTLIAPDLLIAECANVLWKKARRNELNAREAEFAAGLLGRADIELVGMRPYLEAATRIAIALDHPAYDCIRFVTADAGLLRKLGSHTSGRYASRVLGLADAAAWQG